MMNSKSDHATDGMGLPARANAAAVGVAFMFISLGAMVLSIVLSLFLPPLVGYPICMVLYGIKIGIERRHGITSPLSISLLMAYMGLLSAELTGHETMGYSGVVIFSWMIVVVGALLVAGRPFTTFYSGGKGLPGVHVTTSVIWLTTYALSLFTTLALMPNALFTVVPIAICLAGGLATLFINFVWCGRSNERQTSFRREDFQFEQISQAGADFKAFCELYAKGIVNDPKQSDGTKTWQEVAAVVEAAERSLGEDSVVFVCKHEGRLVGSIRCVLDRPGRPFPTEADIDSSFDPLRAHGRVCAIGRLTIEESYRGRGEIINGLFAGFVDLALENDVSYVISAGFRHVLPTYMKLGFEFMFDREDPRHGMRMSHGFVTYPVIFNFAEMVLNRANKTEAKFDFYGVTNKYLAERWFKRKVCLRFLHRLIGKSTPQTLDELRSLLASGATLLPNRDAPLPRTTPQRH